MTRLYRNSSHTEARGITLFLILMLMVVCSTLYLTDINNVNGDPVYITEGNIFRECFKEPFERIVVVMKDGNAITYTTRDEHFIGLGYGWFRQSLGGKGYEMPDIIYCIHNHLRSPFFSQADKNFCRRMKSDGFAGIFAIYHQPTMRIIIYDE